MFNNLSCIKFQNLINKTQFLNKQIKRFRKEKVKKWIKVKFREIITVRQLQHPTQIT